MRDIKNDKLIITNVRSLTAKGLISFSCSSFNFF